MRRMALGLLLAAGALAARADTLTLRNGTSVTGKWLSIDQDQISFLVEGQVKAYARAQVSKVTFGDAAAAEPKPVGRPPAPAQASRPSSQSPRPSSQDPQPASAGGPGQTPQK